MVKRPEGRACEEQGFFSVGESEVSLLPPQDRE